MGTFGKTLSIVGAVVGMVISILVYAEISRTQSGVQAALVDSFQGSSYYMRSEGEDDLPKLTTERVAAPKNGSEARSFEIEHVDGTEELQEGAEAVAVEAEDQGLPAEATMSEKVKFYVNRLIAWFVGEKEETLHMDCKTKKDGGKVCSVVRK
ncbi:hypothetical protein [Celeribacter sp.]|uniref:hypothetical protein n=1 Tax=Celeribacter sp. TaxID=1890673 RepID=UPI003A90D459